MAYLKAIYYIATILLLLWSLFTKDGRDAWGWFFNNFVGAALGQASKLIDELTPTLATIADSFITAWNRDGTTLKDKLVPQFEELARTAFTNLVDGLEAHTNIGPEQWKDVAAQAMADAFGFGLASFGATAAFEAVFPEKLNTLNGVGPMLATLSGFHEVSAATLRPILEAGIARPAMHDANSKFRTVVPSQHDTNQLYGRRLIDELTWARLTSLNGIDLAYEHPVEELSFRPISPRALATAIQDTPFPRDTMLEILRDNAISEGHAHFLADVLEYNSTKNLRNEYANAAIHAYGKGVMSEAELDSILDGLTWSDVAKKFVKDRVALERRVTLATKVEQATLPQIAQGQITPEQGRAQLEAAGLEQWYVDLEVSLATTKATLLAARKEASAEHRAELEHRRELVVAAVENFRSGVLDLTGFGAALVAAGLDAVGVAALVAREEAIQKGRLRLVFGQLLTPEAAATRERQVVAIGQQVKDKLITFDQARNQLVALQVHQPDLDALLARWAATLKKATGAAEYLDPFTGQPVKPA